MKFTSGPLAEFAGRPTIDAVMNPATQQFHPSRWTQLPGLFSWTEVVCLIERTLEVAKREVRATLAQADRSGLLLYHVFVMDAL